MSTIFFTLKILGFYNLFLKILFKPIHTISSQIWHHINEWLEKREKYLIPLKFKKTYLNKN